MGQRGVGLLECRAERIWKRGTHLLGGKVMSVEHLEEVWAGDRPLLMRVCPPLSSPSTPFRVSLLSLCLSLDCVSGCYPIHPRLCHLCLLSPSPVLIPFCFLGRLFALPYIGALFPFLSP